MPYVRTKSPPVPRAIRASSTSRPAMPLTTSWTVPSPPTTTSRSASAAALRASSVRWPGRSERSASPLRPRAAARWASSGQRRPAAPFSAAGLTRNVTRLMARRDGRKRDSRHAVDSRSEVVVGDPGDRLTMHGVVADGQKAAGLHPAQGPDREQHGRLHLDAEHPALRPALVPPGVGVVERVARDDRADLQRLVELLRRVDGGVDEL